MQSYEDILNIALGELKNGVEPEKAAEKFPNHLAQLTEDLRAAQILLSLPKNHAPAPAARRKYALAPAAGKALKFGFKIYKIALAAGGFAAMFALVFTAYAAYTSVPGQNLFKIKKLAEKARLHLAFSDVSKANLQVSFAQNRLKEAQTALNSETGSPELQIAALTELAAQTTASVEAVKKAASANSIKPQDRPLVASLQDLTQKQKNLANQIKPQSQVKNAAQNVIASSQKNTADIKEIQNIIQVAGAMPDQGSLAQLTADKLTVSILGSITKLAKDSITVEKTAFAVTAKTLVKNQDGQEIKLAELKEKDRVNIIGKKDYSREGNELEAKQIYLIKPPQENGEVQGAFTNTNTPPSIKPAPVLPQTNKTEPGSKGEKDPNIATGGFIAEDPSNPQ